MPKVTQQDAVGGVEKMQDMADKIRQADVHIYMDDATGNMYIFNGSELVKIGNKTPQIGDKGDEEYQSKEEKERQAQIEKEKEEFGDEDEEIKSETIKMCLLTELDKCEPYIAKSWRRFDNKYKSR